MLGAKKLRLQTKRTNLKKTEVKYAASCSAALVVVEKQCASSTGKSKTIVIGWLHWDQDKLSITFDQMSDESPMEVGLEANVECIFKCLEMSFSYCFAVHQHGRKSLRAKLG